TGITLKRPFAEPRDNLSHSKTQARRVWLWKAASPEVSANVASTELKVLNELRMPGPWNERKPLTGTADDQVPISWEELKDYADHERGLFKLVALYVDDRFK